MKIVEEAQYSKQAYSDENMLYAFKGLQPVPLSQGLTFLYGRNSNAFPLLFESIANNPNGVTSIKPITLNDTQFYVPVFGKIKTTCRVLGLVDTSITKVGQGGIVFELYLSDNYAHNQQKLTSPDGKYQLRLQSEPISVGADKWKVRVSLYLNDRSAYVPASIFAAPKYWAIGVAQVPMSKSRGTASNSQSMGKMMSQFGLIRHSKVIAGNISSKVVAYDLPMFNDDGSYSGQTTRQWMPFEMKLWEIEIRQKEEEALWDSIYNRDEHGRLTMRDENSGEFVPTGPGVKQILQAGGRYDTFGTRLTLKKLDSTVIQAINSSPLGTIKEIIIYTGRGGARSFHNAIMNVAKGQPYFQSVGADFLTKNQDNMLRYGAYANQYLTPDNVLVTVKVSDYFDKSSRAKADMANGDVIDGFPRFSYTMVALDHSVTENGARNINVVAEQGREVYYRIKKGMSKLPDSFAGMTAGGIEISDEIDESRMEIMKSQGIAITDWSNCFWLEMAS